MIVNWDAEYQAEHDNVVAYSTIHIQRGTCHICKAEGDVMIVDPEQAGYGVIPMCQTCINALFGLLKLGREGKLDSA